WPTRRPGKGVPGRTLGAQPSQTTRGSSTEAGRKGKSGTPITGVGAIHTDIHLVDTGGVDPVAVHVPVGKTDSHRIPPPMGGYETGQESDTGAAALCDPGGGVRRSRAAGAHAGNPDSPGSVANQDREHENRHQDEASGLSHRSPTLEAV